MSFSRTGAGLCIYHFLARSNLNFLHISQWITFPTQSFSALLSVSYNSSLGLHLRPILSESSDDIYSVWFGFFAKRQISLRGLFNVDAIHIEGERDHCLTHS